MTKTIDKDTSHPAPTPHDPWTDWAPQWHNAQHNSSPHSQQETHAPTVAPPQRLSEKNIAAAPRQRLADARLWGSLGTEEQAAAHHIAFAFEAMTRGMRYAASNWQRLPGTPRGTAPAGGDITGPYVDWARACHDEGISHSMVIDILCYDISCAALDRDRRVRHGYSRDNLIAGLRLYARLRGWLRAPLNTPPKSR